MKDNLITVTTSTYISKKFYSATREYCEYKKHVPAPYIRKNFELDRMYDNAFLTICGLGFYELYINGVNITKSALAPYITNPDELMLYDNYVITKHLVVGINCIGIILGNGMQNAMGGSVWDFHKADFRSAPKFAIALEVDGKLMFEADSTFKVKSSPITYDDLRAGEHYDARLEEPDWNSPLYDDTAWDNAILAITPKGEARISTTDPITCYQELSPTKITKTRRGYIYDFGQNLSGVCKLNIQGDRGQRIVMTHGEVVLKNKLCLRNISFNFRTKKNYWQQNRYTLKGNGVEEYTPRFTYQGFRYVLVSGLNPEQATKYLLTFQVMSSDIHNGGEFSCSDNTANKLQELAINSSLSNFFYFPTDCPHREKNGWTGDAALSAEQFLFNFDCARSLKQWIYAISKAQREDGKLPGIIPTGGWGFHWGNGPSWDQVLITIPYFIYKFTGDLDFLAECEKYIYKYLQYIVSKINCKGLLQFGLGDWFDIDRIGKPSTPLVVTDTLMSICIAKRATLIFRALGLDEKAAFAEELSQKLKSSFRTNLVNDNLLVASGTQTAQAMALDNDIFEQEEQEIVFKHLVDIVAKDDGLRLGIVGFRSIFDVLSKYNRSDIAFKLITSKQYANLGYWVDKGATTLLEGFSRMDGTLDNPTRKDARKFSSLNHHMWSCYSGWYYKYLAGFNINPNYNNINEVRIAPHFIEGLTYVKAHHNLPYGRLAIEWEKIDNKTIVVIIDVPPTCKAKLILPYSFKQSEISLKTGKNKLEF